MSALACDIGSVGNVKEYDVKALAKEIGISVAQLLSWERAGVLKSRSFREDKTKTRFYSEKDVMRAVLVKLLMDTGLYTIEKAKLRVDQLG